MKTMLLLSLGLLLIFFGVTGRAGTFLMATFYPQNVTSSNGGA